MKIRLLALVFALLGLAGCAPDLGDFKYIGNVPEVKATILSYKVEPAASEYGSPTLRISGVVQEKVTFPVAHYFLVVSMEVSFGGEKKYTDGFQVEITDGKGSFETGVYLRDIPAGAMSKAISFTFKEAFWFPKTTAAVELEVQKK